LIDKLLQPDIQTLIGDHLHDDPLKLRLMWSKIPDFPAGQVVDQIVSRKKAESKIPNLIQKSILFPPPLLIEQCSSERTAHYKSGLFSGKLCADITGGVGIDSLFFSRTFNKVIYVEVNKWLSQVASHNFQIWGAENIFVENKSAESFISEIGRKFDLIYLDPDRRKKGKKVFRLADTQPNVLDMLHGLLKVAQNVLIKTSPLIEIKQAIHDLKFVHKVWILAVKNEVKEILFQLRNHEESDPDIEALDLDYEFAPFIFKKSEEESNHTLFGIPKVGDFIYDPNRALIKSGAFNLIGNRYDLTKFGPNTQLYFSPKEILFPGRVFRIDKFVSGTTKKKNLRAQKLEVMSKNYFLQAQEIKNRYQIQAGDGKHFLIGAGRGKDALLLLCTKI